MMNFKCLVIGALGSIGRRYVQILENMKCEVYQSDIKTASTPTIEWINNHGIMRIVVASPTFTHLKYASYLSGSKAFVLVEKPIIISKDEYEIFPKKENIRMVSNWLWLPGINPAPGTNTIYYDYFDQGKEKYEYNMAQPIYLGDKHSAFKSKSTIFRCFINSIQVFIEDVQRSYVNMVDMWIKNPENNILWTLEDAYKMTEKLWRYENERKELARTRE